MNDVVLFMCGVFAVLIGQFVTLLGILLYMKMQKETLAFVGVQQPVPEDDEDV